MEIHHVQPIEVVGLFPVLDSQLDELLASLTEEEWNMPTIAGKWTVRDVAAHLLHNNLRGLSLLRDGYLPETPATIDQYADLVTYQNERNQVWTTAAKGLSTKVITELIATSGKAYSDTLSTLDPWGISPLSVLWAGEEISRNWFHIAREYAEKWLHQQQIRHAVGKPGILTKELYYPLIDTYMCALPHAYKNVIVPTGTSVEVIVTTDAGGVWHINRTDEGWVLRKHTRLEPDARLTLDPDTAWKLFSKSLPAAEARKLVKLEGDTELAQVALQMVSVMA